MRFAIFLAGLLLAMATPVAAEKHGVQIRTIIESQIEAFREKELGTAFSFASPMIRGMFGTPENFGRMVQEGYPMIWRPSAVEFLDLRDENGRLMQRLSVRDSSGRLFLFDYDMIAGPDGWRINGVYPVPEPDIGV
ncbi:MAG: DUF4864 domain-containing protein [Paracoccaceae bacterium]|nr:DUF4864 domain-containing protein [Paracoccaceae bacterium]